MEIELKDLNFGTEKGTSQEAVESTLEDTIKNLVKVSLKEEAKANFKEACRIIKVILSNIVSKPEEEKYRQIKKNNPKFHSKFGKYESGLFLLEVLGFEFVDDAEPFYLYTHSDTTSLQQYYIFRSLRIIERAISRSEFIADVHEARVKTQQSLPKVITNKREQDLTMQLQQYREIKKQTSFGDSKKPKIVTLADLDRRAEQPTSHVPRETYNSISSFTDPGNLRIRAFELVIYMQSNQFRLSQGLRELIWNQGLSDIARGHSENMGNATVPFGHQGFSKRFRRFPFRNTRKGAENVAYNYGVTDAAKVSVDGWIQSPGHRKNLLGAFNFMGVGVYMNANGYFYFTQLFALA